MAIGGKTVKTSHLEIVAHQMVKNAITKGPVSINLLLKFMEAHEARQAAREALKAKQIAEGSVAIDWDEEKEKAYQELVARAGKVVQSTPNA
jgi:3-phosphoglycerate kinase